MLSYWQCIPASPIGTVCTSLKACNRRVQSDPKCWSTVWQLVEVLSTKFFVAPSCVQDVKQTPNCWGGKVRQDDVTPVSQAWSLMKFFCFPYYQVYDGSQIHVGKIKPYLPQPISESLQSGSLSHWTRIILAFFKDIAVRTQLVCEVSLESPYCTQFGMAKNIANFDWHSSQIRKSW